MRRITEICCIYWCPRCEDNFQIIWREKPWFGDYAGRCPCGRTRSIWPRMIKDYSRDELSPDERRWDKK